MPYCPIHFLIHACRWIDDEAECDVPVPGIPVPGNLSLFLMVSEPVSEKFGTEKSPGTGLEKI